MIVVRYAANQAMTPSGTISPQSHHIHGPGGVNSANSNLVEVAKDVASDLAKEVASGLFYLGKILVHNLDFTLKLIFVKR